MLHTVNWKWRNNVRLSTGILRSTRNRIRRAGDMKTAHRECGNWRASSNLSLGRPETALTCARDDSLH